MLPVTTATTRSNCAASSFIAPDNTRSIALATRLGATPGAIQLYDGEEFQIFHHPDPEVLQ